MAISNLFGNYECAENTDTKHYRAMSTKGEVMLKESIENTFQPQINWSYQKVTISQKDRPDITQEHFKPLSRKNPKGSLSKTHPWEEFICNVIGTTFFEVKTELPFNKDRMKYYTGMLNCRPTKFIEMYNACMCKAFIPSNLSHIANKFCRKRLGRFDTKLINNLNSRKDIILQLDKDNMAHVIPYFIESEVELDVTSFRKLVGKGVWKKLLKNSENRNKKIAHFKFNARRMCDYGMIGDLNALPTSLIPNNVFGDIPSLDEAQMFKQMKILTKPREQRRVVNIVNDCKRMTRTLERRLPKGYTKWDFNKWQEYHDTLVELINLKKYSKDKFKWLSMFKDTVFESPNYKGVILDSAFDIRNEGDTMKHCVGGYSDYVSKGIYTVISVRNKNTDTNSSTIGLNIYKEGGKVVAKFNQHYKQCNNYVTCEEEKYFAKEAIKQINEVLKDKGDIYESFFIQH